MLRFVQIKNNRYENRLIFLLLANENYYKLYVYIILSISWLPTL
jgi:hypothetical protein